MKWNNITELNSKDYKCGHCGKDIASKEGYKATTENYGRMSSQSYSIDGQIYICHFCEKPTFFDYNDEQFPGAIFGNSVNYISDDLVSNLFEEARRCHSVNAFTSSVMCCRKLLMNISVSEGAKEGLSFQGYIDYLDNNGYVPPNGKTWVDNIRKLGNTANHKIETQNENNSKLILNFTSMLLKFIYEMPGLLENSAE
ncbi:DUF4145 domain-containing protein [Bizionia myxarmorum]|uniref:DUF4145 domain-containing protein n=1 Tax=Bizionia myxarmorum TaxID=291186 RepID=A0A5D0QXQ1_9FLAO|nr:DUF4145 domain-containing protein [Bizionia myxarmorum]TYB73004.1 DUF4145 domain-containing protein [Bizionia myxarmorum]